MNKYLETLKEAKLTALGLLLLISFWLIAGVGTSGVEMRIYHIPIWAILGTVGVWLCAIMIAFKLSHSIKDTDL